MPRALWLLLLASASFVFAADEPVSPPVVEPVSPPALDALAPRNASLKRTQIVVIPIRDQIASPVLYVLRRGLKDATKAEADVVVLDMNTPGGALDVTLEMMEALQKFPGKTITFVNSDALSAGAFIAAATEEIYMTPNGKIGAAAPVTGGGGDIDKTMNQKLVSYLKANVRGASAGKGKYRGQVFSAMIDENFELKIDDKVLKEKGELLTLTGTEARETYGDPPQPLLAAGLANDVDELITQKFGKNVSITRLELTWAEELGSFLVAISPLLLGLGLLAVYIEFKTPGFGVFGITGICLLAVVFLANYVAGLSGHEPAVLFAVGCLLVAIELFFFPGVVFIALTGVCLMLISLVWSMADIWPDEPISFSGDLFTKPLTNLGLGVIIAVVFALLLARFIPRGWFFERLAVAHPISGAAQVAGLDPSVGASAASLVGRSGVAATALFPSGQIEIDGRRYQARLEVGSVAPGSRVVVVRTTDFGLIVEPTEDAT